MQISHREKFSLLIMPSPKIFLTPSSERNLANYIYLERRWTTAFHYIKKRKGKIPENTKQHKDTTQHQTHTGTHILALTHPPTGILKQSRLLTRIERKNDHQRPSFHSTNVEAVRKEIP